MKAPFTVQDLESWVEACLANPEPPWLIKGLIPRGGIALLSGRPKAAGQKSWLAQGLTLSLASGKALGPFQPDTPERVWYLDRESPPYFGAQRWRALQAGHHFPRMHGQIDMTHLGMFYLTNDKMTDMAAEHVVKTKPALVVIDTLAQSMIGSENDVEFTMAAMRGVSKIRDAGAAVLLVHHVKKAAFTTSGGKPDPDLDIRGSSAITGAYDMHLAVRQYGQDRVLLSGGKIAALEAYSYDWRIENDADGNCTSATLLSEPIDVDDLTVEEEDDGKKDPYG